MDARGLAGNAAEREKEDLNYLLYCEREKVGGFPSKALRKLGKKKNRNWLTE